MEDTIVLRIKNLMSYRALYEKFYLSPNKKNQVTEGVLYADVEGVVSEKKRSVTRGIFYQDSGKFLPSLITGSLYCPSHDYHVRYRVKHPLNPEGFLEIEFSLPKYFYGTNVFQFVGMPETSSDANFRNLITGIRRFMQENFPQQPMDQDIQIYRLDICYNQFFNSESDALEYQKLQWDYVKHHCRSKDLVFLPGHKYNWTIKTERYSFKCYFKGDEFDKHDLQRLRRNPRCKYDLSILSKVAHRVLRYECTFRNAHIHYLTMYEFFQSVGVRPQWIKSSRNYQQLTSLFKVSGAAGYLAALNAGPGAGVLEPKEFYMSRVKDYCLRSNIDQGFSSLLLFDKSVTFDAAVYRVLSDFFWEYVKKVQLETRSSIPLVKQRIADYKARLSMKKKNYLTKPGNMTKKGGVNLQRILLPALLSQYVDIRELKDHLPKATYYNLKRDLKNAGIDYKMIPEQIPKPRLDFEDEILYLRQFKQSINSYLNRQNYTAKINEQRSQLPGHHKDGKVVKAPEFEPVRSGFDHITNKRRNENQSPPSS